jgi:pilus assembly protein CpaB
MQFKPILLTVFGLVLAGGSVLISQGMQNSSNSSASAMQQPGAETVTLIAAATDIPFGSEITPAQLTAQDWPAGSIPVGAFQSAAVLLGPDGTLPRCATQAFRAGDVIVDDKVSRFGASVSLTAALADGWRAMAINVSAETSLGGFVSAGARVNIVLTQGRGETLRTGTIMQDVRVLGVDQNADENNRGGQDARTITVQVTPRDSQILALSQQAGILSLTLRNNTSGLAENALKQITMDDVWGIAEQLPEPVVVQIEERTVRVRRGITAQTVVLE